MPWEVPELGIEVLYLIHKGEGFVEREILLQVLLVLIVDFIVIEFQTERLPFLRYKCVDILRVEVVLRGRVFVKKPLVEDLWEV